jgi:hypothetical protein
MSAQLDDFFGEAFQRYFRPGIDACPQLDGGHVEKMFTLTDAVQDPLEQGRRAALAWGDTEDAHARLAAELFVITQQGLLYAAELSNSRRELYYLATPPALFDPFVDQFETADLREGAVVAVDSRCGSELACARPMDAELRRILDEHWALRVDLSLH